MFTVTVVDALGPFKTYPVLNTVECQELCLVFFNSYYISPAVLVFIIYLPGKELIMFAKIVELFTGSKF